MAGTSGKNTKSFCLPAGSPYRRRRVPPCAVKTCAVRPVFARVVGELRAADPSNVQGPVKQNASPGEQSEAPRPRWKPGQEQNPGPENQDSQHMLEQPRVSGAEIQTSAVDTRTAVWVSTAEKIFRIVLGETRNSSRKFRGGPAPALYKNPAVTVIRRTYHIGKSD